MSISKQYLKTKPLCKVTFTLPAHRLENIEQAALLGEFNDWDPVALPMKRSKTGDYTATLNLEKNKEYQFRYLVNGGTWLNDEAADSYQPSPVSYDHNSVVRL